MSLFPGSVYSSPGVLQGDIKGGLGAGAGVGAIEPNLVVSTLIAASTIQTSTLTALNMISPLVTASTITMPAGGTISGVSSITAPNLILNMNGAVLNNVSSVNFAANGRISGVSSITGAGAGNIISIAGSISSLTNVSVSTINGVQPARALSLGTFATQSLSTFNTSGPFVDGPPNFATSYNSNVLSTGHTYQVSYTASVAMVNSTPAFPAPTGDSFSWTIISGATNIKAYQITSQELAQQSMGQLSSIRESITAVFTAGSTNLTILPGYVLTTGTNYQYPSTLVSFTGVTTLIDLGVIPLA